MCALEEVSGEANLYEGIGRAQLIDLLGSRVHGVEDPYEISMIMDSYVAVIGDEGDELHNECYSQHARPCLKAWHANWIALSQNLQRGPFRLVFTEHKSNCIRPECVNCDLHFRNLRQLAVRPLGRRSKRYGLTPSDV